MASTPKRIPDSLREKLEAEVTTMRENGATREDLSIFVGRQLAAHGYTYSIQAVRAITQQGANDAIGRDLHKLRQELAETLSTTPGLDLPQEFKADAEQLVKSIYKSASDIAQQQLNGERAEMDATINAAKEEVGRATRERSKAEAICEELQNQIERLAKESGNQNTKIQELSSLLAKAEANNETLKNALKDAEINLANLKSEKDLRIAELEREIHHQTESRASDQRHLLLQIDQAREGHKRDLERIQKNDELVQSELKSYKLKTAKLQEKLNDALEKKGILTGENSALSDHIAVLEKQVERLIANSETEKNLLEMENKDIKLRNLQNLIQSAYEDGIIFEIVEEYNLTITGDIKNNEPAIWAVNESEEKISEMYGSLSEFKIALQQLFPLHK